MGKLASVDAGNDYLVPWAWSYTTVAINKAKVQKALGSTPMPERLGSGFQSDLYGQAQVVRHRLPRFADRGHPAGHALSGQGHVPTTRPITRQLASCWPRCGRIVRMFTSTMIDDLAGGKAASRSAGPAT